MRAPRRVARAPASGCSAVRSPGGWCGPAHQVRGPTPCVAERGSSRVMGTATGREAAPAIRLPRHPPGALRTPSPWDRHLGGCPRYTPWGVRGVPPRPRVTLGGTHPYGAGIATGRGVPWGYPPGHPPGPPTPDPGGPGGPGGSRGPPGQPPGPPECTFFWVFNNSPSRDKDGTLFGTDFWDKNRPSRNGWDSPDGGYGGTGLGQGGLGGYRGVQGGTWGVWVGGTVWVGRGDPTSPLPWPIYTYWYIYADAIWHAQPWGVRGVPPRPKVTSAGAKRSIWACQWAGGVPPGPPLP